MDERLVVNRTAWEERVPIHLASEYYDVEGFVAGRCSLRPFEVDDVGDVAGLDLVHLQCHFGQDTLSWARRGAHVTGLDFSAAAIAEAQALAARLGLDARFVEADVYRAAEVVEPASADVVYTGIGALVWLPDVWRWAEVVASLLRPGGMLYLCEFHPFTDMLAEDALVVTEDYFTRPDGTRYEVDGTYTDGGDGTLHNVTWEWTHPIGDVVTAVVAAGLQVELLAERDVTLWQRWPFLERQVDGTYRLPAGSPRIPLLYSLRARLPATPADRADEEAGG
ncbi:MAG: class I SAM-dependent methyltransferase [Acidimicrobiia bacterium]|nr:class I SAM-dependent methyltransferase [Acidimicrobiia bacterium]